MTFSAIKMEVTQSVTIAGKTKREPVGEVTIFVPTLFNLISTAVAVMDSKTGKELLTDEGLPVYTDDSLNFIQSSILASVKASARNKLTPKTANLKDGLSIATTWAELTAESAGNNGVHLVIIREVKDLFAKFVATLGKTATVQANITKAFNNAELLASSSADVKGKLLNYISDFVDTLNEEAQTKYNKYLTKIAEAASSEEISAEDY